MARQLKQEQQPDTTVRWWCEGCAWDVSEPPASYHDVLVAFLKHDCASYEVVFRRSGE